MKTLTIYLLFSVSVFAQTVTPPSNGGGAGGTCSSLGGDVTGTCAASTVVNINNGSVPASATVLGTNSSSQAIAATTTGTGTTAVLSVSPALTGTPTAPTPTCATSSGTLATTASLGCVSGSLFQAVAVQAATTTTLPANTYNNGTAGVGATLTGNSNGAFAAVDGYTASVGDRILVNNEANALHNGVYSLTTLGNGGAPYVLTRATDFNTTAEINGSGAIPTLNGTVNNNVLWILSNTISAIGTGQNNISYSVGAATPFPAYTITNASSTGTVLNKLVKLTGAPSTAVRAATTDTTGIIGICLSNCGTTGAAIIGYTNTLGCVFDGATTAGDYVQISGSTAGDCHDGGSTYPTSGGDILGRVLTTNGSGGTFQLVWGSLDVANKGVTVTCTAPQFLITTTTCATPVLTQNSQSAAYTTVLADAGKLILHPSSDNNARTFTIDSNANVAYPTGTCITFVNMVNTVTIAITSDTMTFMGSNTTGSRTLAVGNWATACKIASTAWVIGGSSGLT